MLVFDDWEPIASKTAVAVGFVIVVGVASFNLDAAAKKIVHRAILSLIWTLILAGLCVAMYILISSGYAPSQRFLFWVRDIGWRLLYIIMLVMAGVTVALTQMRWLK